MMIDKYLIIIMGQPCDDCYRAVVFCPPICDFCLNFTFCATLPVLFNYIWRLLILN